MNSHHDKPGSIPGGISPGFSHLVIVPDDDAGRWVFSGISLYRRYFIPALLHTHLASPSSLLNSIASFNSSSRENFSQVCSECNCVMRGCSILLEPIIVSNSKTMKLRNKPPSKHVQLPSRVDGVPQAVLSSGHLMSSTSGSGRQDGAQSLQHPGLIYDISDLVLDPPGSADPSKNPLSRASRGPRLGPRVERFRGWAGSVEVVDPGIDVASPRVSLSWGSIRACRKELLSVWCQMVLGIERPQVSKTMRPTYVLNNVLSQHNTPHLPPNHTPYDKSPIPTSSGHLRGADAAPHHASHGVDTMRVRMRATIPLTVTQAVTRAEDRSYLEKEGDAMAWAGPTLVPPIPHATRAKQRKCNTAAAMRKQATGKFKFQLRSLTLTTLSRGLSLRVELAIFMVPAENETPINEELAPCQSIAPRDPSNENILARPLKPSASLGGGAGVAVTSARSAVNHSQPPGDVTASGSACEEGRFEVDHPHKTDTSVDLRGRHTLQAGVEPVDKKMARGTELSDFDMVQIVGCYLSGLSSQAIARKRPTDLDISDEQLHISPITTSNKARLLRWCLDRRNLTLEQWNSVLWSDESRLTLFRSDGRVWVWRLPGERLLPECIVQTRKFGGGGVMVYGCFTAYGVGPLVFVRGSMNTEA
ncbi:hypothetical protein PR048_026766 [Dryococelus australis]|uniref:Uncharacterized protein n=1 Tax=Dryococelus australis TaxID=614101 RepID=A0ABQ9GMA8_9NEOP|nr:hypothetical protein PR048_026766 [Dryococelus australis]